MAAKHHGVCNEKDDILLWSLINNPIRLHWISLNTYINSTDTSHNHTFRTIKSKQKYISKLLKLKGVPGDSKYFLARTNPSSPMTIIAGVGTK